MLCELARRNGVPAVNGHNCNIYFDPSYDGTQVFSETLATAALPKLLALNFTQQVCTLIA